jgi:hypothetical protein
MKEFEISLAKMKEGNMTLVDDIGRIQLAIQEAIRSAFKSPEVMKMFAKRENGALRSRLSSLQQDHRLGKISSDDYLLMSSEVIGALDKLGEPLEAHERSLLENVSISFLLLLVAHLLSPLAVHQKQRILYLDHE